MKSMKGKWICCMSDRNPKKVNVVNIDPKIQNNNEAAVRQLGSGADLRGGGKERCTLKTKFPG